jgi:hypothetical protein
LPQYVPRASTAWRGQVERSWGLGQRVGMGRAVS